MAQLRAQIFFWKASGLCSVSGQSLECHAMPCKRIHCEPSLSTLPSITQKPLRHSDEIFTFLIDFFAILYVVLRYIHACSSHVVRLWLVHSGLTPRATLLRDSLEAQVTALDIACLPCGMSCHHPHSASAPVLDILWWSLNCGPLMCMLLRTSSSETCSLRNAIGLLHALRT